MIDSLGLEYEFAKIPWGQVSAPRGWNLIRDGSCTTRETILGQAVVRAPEVFDLPTDEVGGEFVSPPLSIHQINVWYSDLARIIEQLANLGARPSNETSVHIHIEVGKPPLFWLKNLIQLCLAIEPQVFRLAQAELGYHRGERHHDFMYCRPLGGLGPQVVLDGRGFFRWAFQLDKLMNAETPEEFYMSFCRADQQPTKWIPARYYWVNPAAIVKQGTIEFRVFNQTLEPSFIKAWIDLSRAITIRCFSAEPIVYGSGLQTVFKNLEGYFFFKETPRLLGILWSKGHYCPPCGPQVNHLVSDRDRRVRLEVLPQRIRPNRVNKAILRELNLDNV